MVIAVDAMGGDCAPRVVVEGALRSAGALPVEIVLVGRPDQIEQYLPSPGRRPKNLRTVAADDVIPMAAASPRRVLRRRDSSMFVAVDMVGSGEAQAVVSAGNSGALLALAHMRLGTIEGVRRPGIAAPMVTLRGAGVIIDAGANVDCQPIHLAQFGLMGSTYAEYALRIAQPRVGLLNIGSEPSKGNSLTAAAFDLLTQMPINFVGNVEAYGIFNGEADVAVADGFAGNIALKMAEAMAQFVMDDLTRCLDQSLTARIGAFLLRDGISQLRERYDYASYGGALLLGLQGIAVVGHGRSDAKAIASAISVAYHAIEGGVVPHLEQSCSTLVGTPS